jgi:glycosyltransferase involved in cell wall biosynthesis
MNASGRYCYLGGDALHTGMYVALIQRLENEGLIVDLVTRIKLSLSPFSTLAAWRGRGRLGPNTIEAVRGQIRGSIHTLPIWSPLSWLSVPLLARAIGGCRRDRRVVLHTRQVVMGRLALALRRWCPSVRVIPELEGDPVAEAQYKHALIEDPSALQALLWRIEAAFYRHHEGRMVRGGDAVVCVSHKLKAVLVDRYRLTPQQAERIRVFPSVASRERFAFLPRERDRIRRALGLDGKFVVIYNGNLAGRWQVPDKLVQVFQLIRAERPDAVFLVLSPEEQWRHIRPHLEASELSPNDYLLRTCPHDEVAAHLSASDVGLLLRDRHPMNEVAAPGKFAEYVLSGLPIIMTDGIGDFSEVARESECACVLPGIVEPGASREVLREFCLRDFTSEQRQAFSRWGAERFAIELYVPQLAALYRSLAGDAPGTT